MLNFNKVNNTRCQKVRAVLVVAFCAMVVACTTAKVTEEKEYSGFLSDYSQLQPGVSADQAAVPVLRWTSPLLAERNYSKIMIDPIALYPAPQPGPQLRSEVLTSMLVYLNKAMRTEVAKKYEIVSEPASDVVRLRAAITGVKTNPEALAAYEYIPVAFIFASASKAAGKRDQMVEIFAEAELTDSLSGERLAAGVRKGFGEPVENEDTQVELENVRPVLDGLAQSVVSFLDTTLK